MTESKTKTQSLHAKLAEVAAEVGHIGKDGRNEFHRYSFTSAAAVMAKVNPALSSRGIACAATPEIVEVREVATKSGSQNMYVVRVSLEFTDGATGQTMTTSGLGSGLDAGDKAIMKAQTAAHKYALKLAFSIDFGDDPEADSKTDREVGGQPAPKPQRPGAQAAAPAKAPPDAASYTFRRGEYAGVPIGTLDSTVVAKLLADTQAQIAAPGFPAKHRGAARAAIEACSSVLEARLGAELGRPDPANTQNGTDAAAADFF